jgi:hypothetical protein
MCACVIHSLDTWSQVFPYSGWKRSSLCRWCNLDLNASWSSVPWSYISSQPRESNYTM